MIIINNYRKPKYFTIQYELHDYNCNYGFGVYSLFEVYIYNRKSIIKFPIEKDIYFVHDHNPILYEDDGDGDGDIPLPKRVVFKDYNYANKILNAEIKYVEKNKAGIYRHDYLKKEIKKYISIEDIPKDFQFIIKENIYDNNQYI